MTTNLRLHMNGLYRRSVSINGGEPFYIGPNAESSITPPDGLKGFTVEIGDEEFVGERPILSGVAHDGEVPAELKPAADEFAPPVPISERAPRNPNASDGPSSDGTAPGGSGGALADDGTVPDSGTGAPVSLAGGEMPTGAPDAGVARTFVDGSSEIPGTAPVIPDPVRGDGNSFVSESNTYRGPVSGNAQVTNDGGRGGTPIVEPADPVPSDGDSRIVRGSGSVYRDLDLPEPASNVEYMPPADPAPTPPATPSETPVESSSSSVDATTSDV